MRQVIFKKKGIFFLRKDEVILVRISHSFIYIHDVSRVNNISFKYYCSCVCVIIFVYVNAGK